MNLCCTVDYDGNGILDFVDHRVHYLWENFIAKDQTEEEQKSALTTLYATAYPLSPPVIVVNLPKLDCSDYDGSSVLDFVDHRLHYLWENFIDHGKAEEAQKSDLTALYATAYPLSPAVTVTRIPALLDPANCGGLHGWFVTPWHSTVELVGTKYGWLE